MTKDNYEEMYAGVTTEIFAPFLAESYRLVMYAKVYSHSRSNIARCRLVFPKKFARVMKLTGSYNYVMDFYYNLRSDEIFAGLYTIQCSTYFTGVMLERHSIILRKRFVLNFFEG